MPTGLISIQSEVTGLGLFLVGLDLVAILKIEEIHEQIMRIQKGKYHRTQYGYPPVRLIGLVIKARQLGPEWIGLNDPCMEGFHPKWLERCKKTGAQQAVLVDALAFFFFYVESAVLARRINQGKGKPARLLRQNSFRHQVLCDKKRNQVKMRNSRKILWCSPPNASCKWCYYPLLSPPLETQPHDDPSFHHPPLFLNQSGFVGKRGTSRLPFI